jgi:hypothetical protein
MGRLADEINQAGGLHVELNREGDLVQHVGGLVNPTALVPGALEDLFDRLPEAERAVADPSAAGGAQASDAGRYRPILFG